MQFSDTNNKNGLIQDIDYLCHTTSASYPIADKTRNINQAYHDVSRLIWSVSSDWQYDDRNNSDMPTASVNLTHNTKNYSIPSTAQKIERVEVIDNIGNYYKLTPIDLRDVGVAMAEFQDNPGLPVYYDLVGNYISLYPTPSSASVTTSAGLIIWLNRNVTEFSVTATTATPGFVPQFHRILSLSAALIFERDVNQRVFLESMKKKLEEGLVQFYGGRHPEYKTRIKPRLQTYL